MNPVFKMIPGLIVGSVVGIYVSAKYPDIALGLMLPIALLTLAGLFLLDLTGRMDTWLRSPEMILP